MSDVTGAIIDRLRTLEARLAALERHEMTPLASIEAGLSMAGPLALGPLTKLTIASGVITVTGSLHYVESEDSSPDSLTTINGGVSGQLLVLRSFSSDRDITVTDGGNLFLAGNCTLDAFHDTITLIRIGTNWYELSRSGNA